MSTHQKKLVGIITIVVLLVISLTVFIYAGQRKTPELVSPIASSTPTTEATSTPPEIAPEEKLYNYIQIHDACNWASVGTCVNMRSGPGTKYPVITKLRNGVVLKTSDSTEVDGQIWYKIIFSTELSHPERVKGDLYVAGTEYVRLLQDSGDQYATHVNASSTKRIVVDISQEILYAYEGDTLFMKTPISTGLEFTATPKGAFFVLKKTPSRYMQGPLKGSSNDQYYDLPGVPWDLYFTKNGDVIHGAYWHNKFGQPWSHGCVNLSPEESEKLYNWAEIGMPVEVQK